MVIGDDAVSGKGESSAHRAIAAALEARDERAFAVALDGHYGRMLRLAHTLAADRDAARSAVRRAWLRVLRDRAAPDQMPSLAAWLFWLTISELSAEPATDSVPASTAPDESAAFEPEGSRWEGWWLDDAAPAPWPDGADQATERRAAIEEELRSLSPLSAALLVLHDAEALSGVEIAAVLGMPRETQIALLHDARTTLRRAVDSRLAPGTASE
jgi:DNA-directed RNA polymerase specialized sigma24 family protein